MELRSIRYFIAVAEELHFGRAAKKVLIAQPALSIQIKSLEQELGGKLFERDKRNVRLTEAGRLFLEEARKIVQQAEHATLTVKRAFKGELGVLRVAFTGNAAFSGILSSVLCQYRPTHRGVEIQLEEVEAGSQLQGLLDHAYDVAFLPMLSVSPPEKIETVILNSWPLMLGMAGNHPLAKKNAVRLEEIQREPFIVYSSGSDGDGVNLFRHIVDFNPVVVHETNNLNLMLTMIGAGMGAGMLPQSLAYVCKYYSVCLRPFAEMNLQLDCSFAWRRDEDDAVTLGFIDTVKHGVADRRRVDRQTATRHAGQAGQAV